MMVPAAGSLVSVALVLSLAGAAPAQVPAVEIGDPTRQAIRWLARAEPGEPSHGTLLLEHQSRELPPEEIAAIESAQEGARFALGAGFAALLDTDLELSAGRAKLPPGLFLLLAQKERKDGWSLVCVPLEAALAAGWDGRGAPADLPGVALPMEARRVEPKGNPRTRVAFGFGANQRKPDLHASLGVLQLTTTLEPKARKGQPAAWQQKGRRATLRLTSTSGQPGAGEFVMVAAGLLGHDAASAAELEALKAGGRFPLGRDFWSTLATSLPLFAGELELAPGERALALERTKSGWALLLLDHVRRRSELLDLYRVAEARKGFERLPLAHAPLDPPVDTLAFDLLPTDGGIDLEIRYGAHLWTAALQLAP